MTLAHSLRGDKEHQRTDWLIQPLTHPTRISGYVKGE